MIDLPETLFEDELDADLDEGLSFYDDREWQKAIAPLEIAARKGNVTAIFKLANSLDNLDREDEAIPLWEAAANFGHVGACNNYAIRLKRSGDNEGAQALYLRAAQSGNAQAIFNYAMTLDEEDQTAEFREWLRKSADAGMLRAQAMLGKHLHEHGEQEEGLELLEDAMEKGSLSAHLLAANIANTNEQYARALDLADKGLALPLSDDDKHLVRNAYLIRGIAADHLGMREQAISDVTTSKEMGFDVSIAPRHLREPDKYPRPRDFGSSQSAKHHAATRRL
jgi:TPR repeat protein